MTEYRVARGEQNTTVTLLADAGGVVQAKVGDQWQVIGKGSAIYERTWIRLAPVTAQAFRLRFATPGEFTLHEFQLY